MERIEKVLVFDKETKKWEDSEMKMEAKRVFFAMSLAVVLASSAAVADIETGLVGHWKLDEEEGTTAADSSGNGIDGTLTNGPVWVTGHIRGGLQLDGSDDYVETNYTTNLATWTASVWVTSPAAPDATSPTGPVHREQNLQINWNHGDATYRGAAALNVGGTWYAASFGTLQADTWYHLTATYDGESLKAYTNGVLVTENTTPSGNPTAEANSLKLGRHAANAQYFGGTIDDVRIYDRALSDEDVTELYNWTGGANAGDDFRVYGGDRVSLVGSGPPDATSVTWQQVAGTPTVTLEATADDYVKEFDAPELEIGTILTFRLTVDAPSTQGVTTDDVDVIITAINPPKPAPGPLRVMPVDLGTTGLGFRVTWPPLLDAEEYDIGLDLGGGSIFWLETIGETSYEQKGMTEGQSRGIFIRGRNDHGASDDPASIANVSYVAMRNLARPAAQGGKSEPSDYVYAISHYAITGMNNILYDDTNDSWDGTYKEEDCWGYLWPSAMFFDHIAYHTGDMFGDGGWFLDLKVQYTEDGATWLDAPIVKIEPAYDFTDRFTGKDDFARYDIQIPTLRGTGVRIYGTPGGTATFTSIAELEVFGLQTQGPLVVQGIDAECNEGMTALLDGSLTFSTAGPITSYQWTGPGGITLTNPTQAVASFEAPIVSEDTLYVFSLEASDGTNTATDEDVRILVKNVATTAVAGADQSVEESTQATLDGSGSLTTTGNITYVWTQTGGTNVNVSGKTTATVTFTAPIIWGYEEPLTFKLDVNDGAGGTSSDEVVVTVRNALAWPAYPLAQAATTYYMQNLLHLGTASTDRLMNPHTWGNIPSGFDPLESFGGVRNIRPYPGLAFDFTGLTPTPNRNPMVWTPVFSNSGVFDNSALDEFQMHYSVYLLSPGDRDVRWHVGHDDEVRVFCNGDLVVSRDAWDNNIPATEDSLLANGGGLKKGLNIVTGWYEEGGGGARISIGVTDLGDAPFDDLLYSLGPSLILTDAYASRSLPTSYGPGAALNVELAMKVNPVSTPSSVIVSETIPSGIPEANVSAPGATVAAGKITWNLSGTNVKNQTLAYSLTVPTEGVTDVMDFAGTLTFGTTVADVFGEDTVYPEPTAPRSVTVEMLMAAHLSWSAPVTEGIVSYRIERSVNGGVWEEIATTAATSYTDMTVVQGESYSYRVYATNVAGAEGPASRETEQASLPAMEVREAENFNYGGGQYPGFQDCPAAIEAPDAATIGTPQQYDFWHPNKGGDATTRVYRPNDDIGIHYGTDIVTRIGWVSPGSWWRYTFNAPQAGWIKLTFRIATHTSRQQATIAAYWDEVLIGSCTFANNFVLTWEVLDDQIQTTAGEHTLRLEAVGAGDTDVFDFDTIAVGYNWSPPTRKNFWEENFDAYATTADVFSPTVGGWTRGNTTNSAGSWTLWDTDTMLGSESGDIPAMEGNYMVSDSDLSGAGVAIDEEMISPEIDSAGWTKVRLNFNYNYRIYDDLEPTRTQDAEVDIRSFDSATGWSSWTNLLHLDRSLVPATLDPPMLSGSQTYDLSAYDGKKIQLKFHFFNAEYDYWFAFDKVVISGVQEAVEIPLPDIVLAEGNVTVSWAAFASQYRIEYTADLKGTWTSVAGPITQTSFTEAMRGDRTGYYRIAGE